MKVLTKLDQLKISKILLLTLFKKKLYLYNSLKYKGLVLMHLGVRGI